MTSGFLQLESTLVGIEVFLKLFHLMCHLFKSDKK
jgi:hypothetical protein